VQSGVRRRRLRIEDTDCLAISDLRPLVERDTMTLILADGTPLHLRWREIKGVFTSSGHRGTAKVLVGVCPSCDRDVRVLRKARSWGLWGCRRCLNLIYPSQRRPGGHKSHLKRKPSTWHIAAICDQQTKIAKLLALPSWPPDSLAWDRWKLMPARPLSTLRREALLNRLEALETLRISIWCQVWEQRYGILSTAKSSRAVAQSAHRLALTRWAMRENWRPKGKAPPP